LVDCCDVVREHFPDIKNVLVLGSATGEILGDFKKSGLEPFGVEVNEYAYNLTHPDYKKRVFNMDMRQYIPSLAQQGVKFDLIFSNSLVYLNENEIGPFLKLCSHVSRYFHFYCSFVGNAANDPYRQTLKTYAWWDNLFNENGFKRTPWSLYMWEKYDET